MIDIHCHIIPEVDDGSDCVAETLLMMNAAAETGTRIMVATPHYYNIRQCTVKSSREMIERRFSELKREVLGKTDVTLLLGAELFGVNSLEQLRVSNELITLNGSRYILVEFDFDDSPSRALGCVSRLASYGYVPVVAHPERYVFLQRDFDFVYRLLDAGCLLQVNKGSPMGRYGYAAARLASALLEQRLVHVIASDCHSPYQRTPDLSEAHRWLSMRFSARYIDTLFNDNPMKLINNLSI